MKKWTFKFDQELEQYSMSYPYGDKTAFYTILSAMFVQKIIQIYSQLLLLCVKEKGSSFFDSQCICILYSIYRVNKKKRGLMEIAITFERVKIF